MNDEGIGINKGKRCYCANNKVGPLRKFAQTPAPARAPFARLLFGSKKTEREEEKKERGRKTRKREGGREKKKRGDELSRRSRILAKNPLPFRRPPLVGAQRKEGKYSSVSSSAVSHFTPS